MEKNKFISDKIKKLKSEGYNTAQATAIAYKYWKEVPKAQEAIPPFTQYDNPSINTDYYNIYTDRSEKPGMFPKDMFTQFTQVNSEPIFKNPFGQPTQRKQFDLNLPTIPSAPKVDTTQTPPSANYITLTDNQVADDSPMVDNMDMFTSNNQRNAMAENKVENTINENYDSEGNPIRNTEAQKFLNPYGGVDPMGGLIFGANAAGRGNKGQAALGFARFGLGALREGMSAYASGKAGQDAFEYNRNELYKPTEGIRRQEGGKTVAEVVAGNYITNNPFEYNIELEGQEYVKSPDGQIQGVVGEKHLEGGVKANVEPGSKILSNYTKIGKENAKYFEENYGLKLKPNGTFSKIQKLLDRKLGLDKVEKEEAKVIKDVEKNTKLKDATTKKLNDEVLADELKAAQMKKDEVASTRQMIFDEAFERQEQIPKKGDGTQVLGKDGNPVEVKEENYYTELAEKYQIDPQRAKELMQEGGMQEQQMMMQQIAQALQEGADPNEILQQLVQSGMPQEQAQQLLEAIMQQMQAQPQEQEMMQQGGITDPNSPLYYAGQDGYNITTSLNPTAQGYETKANSIVDNGLNVERTQSFTGDGYGKQMADVEKTLATHSWYFDTEEKKNAFRNAIKNKGSQEEVLKFQRAYNQEIEKRAKNAGLSQEEINKIKSTVGFSDSGVQKEDGMFGAFTSTRPLFDFIKNDKGEVEVKDEETQTVLPTKKDAQGNVILPPYDFLLPPSALQTIYKPQVGLNRATPMKTSVEPNLVALESQRGAMQAQIAGLTPQQQAALSASFLGSTQQNANQAISTVSAQNLAEQQKADFYNMAAGDKETLMNEQFNVGYQDKMAQSLSNQERDLRAYFNELNDINRFNYNFVDRRNLINQAFDNMKVDGSGNIVATNLTNPLQGIAPQGAMTPEQQKKKAQEQAKVDVKSAQQGGKAKAYKMAKKGKNKTY